MSTKKLQIIGGMNADTLDGMHADEFAAISDNPVFALEDSEDIYAEVINADTFGGRTPDEYVTQEEITEAIGDNLEYAKKVGNPRNLLDNSDFTNPVNQRGFSDGQPSTDNAYFIDRWKTNQGATKNISLALGENGLTVTGLSSSAGIRQIIPRPKHDVTFAAKVDGEIIVCHAKNGVYTPAYGTICTIFVSWSDETLYVTIQNRVSSPCEYTVEWAALYEGEYTAETLPEYQPKGYMAELMECRRYFKRIYPSVKSGLLTSSGTLLRIGIQMPMPMRLPNPTISDFSLTGLRTVNGTNMTPTINSYTASVYADGSVDLQVSIAVISDTTNNTPIACYCSMGLSADL